MTLSMLKNASPNEIDDEEETICSMEQKSAEMGNLIDKKVLVCEDKKESLEDLNEKFLQALALYQQLMKEPVNVGPATVPPSYQTTSVPQHSLQFQQQMFAHVSYLFVCLFIYLLVFLFVCLFVCLFFCLFFCYCQRPFSFFFGFRVSRNSNNLMHLLLVAIHHYLK